MKGNDVILWDSKTRQAKGKIGKLTGECMLDVLHAAAVVGRDANTGAAVKVVTGAELENDATFLTALEAVLNVLPVGTGRNPKETPLAGASNDFDALERIRKLGFVEQVPEPVQKNLFSEIEDDESEDDDAEE